MAMATAALTAHVLPARAQAYPNKPIRYIVPVSAGGGADTLGRNVTERWAKVLGQSFIGPHVMVHGLMLRVAVARREIGNVT